MTTDKTTPPGTDELRPEDLPREMADAGGIFYPTGHLLAAFPSRDDAERARHELASGADQALDCSLITSEQMAEFARRNLAEHQGFLARLGKSDEKVQKHLEHARRGDTFLLIRAPDDEAAERAMKVIRNGAFEYVDRYRMLAIERLK